ncbi:hypothetical protein GFGA_1d0537 [Gluconobacter frateurii NBRC 103465]|nr:hypothetical protein GFGA_1d0537 [Gluconobacter frateurii NBRC 103465]
MSVFRCAEDGCFCGIVGIRRPTLSGVALRESLTFQALTVIQIFDQCAFSARSSTVNALVMLPEHQSVDGPCIVNVFVQTLANGRWKLIESLPVVAIKSLPDFMSESAIIEGLWVDGCLSFCGHMLFWADKTTR